MPRAARALLVAVIALMAFPAQAGILEQVAFQGDDLGSLSVLERFSDRALAEAFASIGIDDSSDLRIGFAFGDERIFFPTERQRPGGIRCGDPLVGECNDVSDTDIADFENLRAFSVLHLEGPGDGVLALFTGRFDFDGLRVVDSSFFVASRPIPEPASAFAFAVGTLVVGAAVRLRR